jgi:hypothetical protein
VTTEKLVKLNKLCYVPELKYNLMSLTKGLKHGWTLPGNNQHLSFKKIEDKMIFKNDSFAQSSHLFHWDHPKKWAGYNGRRLERDDTWTSSLDIGTYKQISEAWDIKEKFLEDQTLEWNIYLWRRPDYKGKKIVSILSSVITASKLNFNVTNLQICK